MYPSKPYSTKIVMSALTGVLGSVAVLGNGSILALVARFKSLRNFPNILIANLAAVDLLNAAINMPIYTIYTIFEASWFRGKTLAIVTASFGRLFIVLNLASMMALVVNVYCAVKFDLKYFVWKTKTKAVVCAGHIWVISTVMVVLSSIPLFDIDLGDAHVSEYSGEIYMRAKYFVAPLMAVFIILGGVVGFLTTRSIKKRNQKRAEMNLSALQAKARLQHDIKVTKTIAITVAAYFLSYVPAILYAVLGHQAENLADSWFGFIAWYAIFFSSAVNPFIYYFRTSRFRSAFKPLFKDPFGSSDFKETPNNWVKGRGKGNLDVGIRGRGNQAKYRRERRNGIVLLSTEALQAQMRVLEVGANSTDEGGNLCNGNTFRMISCALSYPANASLSSAMIECREGCAKKEMMAKKTTFKEKEATTLEENEIASKKSGMEIKSGKGKRPLAFTRNKVNLLDIPDPPESRYQGEKKGEVLTQCTEEKEIKKILEERRNTIMPVVSI